MGFLRDIGAIASFCVPAGWVVFPEEVAPGRRTTYGISPYDSMDVSVSSCVRGVELSEKARSVFMATLYSEFHDLNAEEILQLEEILEGLSQPRVFSVREARTSYLNSRRVIVLTGKWLETDIEQTSCFIDLSGDSWHVQNLSLTAPVGLFQRYRQLFEEFILFSIRWKQVPEKSQPELKA